MANLYTMTWQCDWWHWWSKNNGKWICFTNLTSCIQSWKLFIISCKLFCNTFFSLLYSHVGSSLEKSPRSCSRHSWDRCPSIPPDSIASFLSFIKCQLRSVLSSHSILCPSTNASTLNKITNNYRRIDFTVIGKQRD